MTPQERERRVEVGQFIKLKLVHVMCYYQCFPSWLLLLDALECKTLTMLGLSSMEDFEEHCTTKSASSLVFLRWIVQRIGSDKFRFEVNPFLVRADALLFVSGSLPFIQDYARICSTPLIFILDNHFQGKLRQGRPPGTTLRQVKWLRLQHRHLGGPTSAVNLVGTLGLDVVPDRTTLRRTIRNVFDAGRRPSCIREHEVNKIVAQFSQPVRDRNFYEVDDLLFVDALHLPVVHSTRLFSSGWGRRVMSFGELGAAFGYPRSINAFLEPWIFELPPYSVLLAVFRSAVDVFGASLGGVADDPSNRLLLSSSQSKISVLPTTATWLPKISKWLPHSWTDAGTASQTASKRDDSAIPIHLWNSRISLVFPNSDGIVAALRTLCLARYWRNIMTDFRYYMRDMYGPNWVQLSIRAKQHRVDRDQRRGGDSFKDEDEEYKEELKDESNIVNRLLHDMDVASEVVGKLTRSSWWDWNMGSSLIFWRWNKEFREIARDGMLPFIQGTLPTWKSKRKRKILEPKFSLIANKLKTIVERNYVVCGKVSSWSDFFEVPKGADDIRLVYNGTSCGLNQVVWVPSFWLPFPRSASRVLDYGYFSADMDLGEMFHNFPLHDKMQEYSGIDLSPFHKHLNLEENSSTHYRWTRTWMGARSSPYSCVRYYYLIEEFVRGNHLDGDNELRWDEIILNLPGSKTYDPRKPRVQKWDKFKQLIAGDIVTFVDDGRVSGQTLEHAWSITRQVCSRIQYKGTQVASRKIHEPRQDPGPWAGAVFESSEFEITKTVSLDKWNKGKLLVETLWSQLNGVNGLKNPLSYKELERTRGFLCHLSMTFEVLVPYLKGFHLTLASHLNRRDKEGWKYTDKMWKVYLDHQVEEGFLTGDEATRMTEGTPYSLNFPETIIPVSQLKDDVHALKEFLSFPVPPKVQERSTMVDIVRYGFGDASGSGFGSTIETANGLKYRIGVWGADDEHESSNFKELENVVSTIEEEARCDNLKGSVLFFFTDNSTVEGALNKGNSTSRKLFELVVRFRKLFFEYGTQIIVSHVSGKRMIQQGTDGVSRGNLSEGVGSGLDMLSFVPLHLGACERHPPLKDWLVSWMSKDVEFLQPSGWFTRGHDHDGGYRDGRGFWRITTREGLFVWAPPPAAGEVALEELRKALIKRQKSTHVFICPRLLTTEWMKQLYKTSDLLISIPAGAVPEAWPSTMLEPLTIGFIFPLLHCKPWQRKSTPQMFFLERQLSRMFKGEGLVDRNFLCEFFKRQRELSSLSELLVRRVLYLRK